MLAIVFALELKEQEDRGSSGQSMQGVRVAVIGFGFGTFRGIAVY